MVFRARRAVSIAVVSLLAAGCSTPDDGNGIAGADPVEELLSTTAPPVTPPPCRPTYEPLDLTAGPTPSPDGLLALSAAVYSCVDRAVIVDVTADLGVLRAASVRAAGAGAPLLGFHSTGDMTPLISELRRLGVEELVAVEPSAALTTAVEEISGELDVEVTTATTTTSAPPSPSTTTPTTGDEIKEGTDPQTAPSPTTAPGGAGAESPSADGAETPPEPTMPSTTLPTTTTDGYQPPAELAAPSPGGPVVLVRSDDPATAYLLAPGVAAGGGEVVTTDLTDTDELRALVAGRPTALVGDASPTTRWQVALAESDVELFGGGTRAFPDRRIVAYYGNPLTYRLGLLGETDPERAVERVTERAARYEAEGLPPVQPGFEIIATVASTSAGEDGNYSNEMELDVLRPWIDTALANEVMVILDLQPGRTDFVTQARRYEEFLRLPNVGLALDPEWRLEPDQRHLRQIGRVSAEEVNAVVDYLAELVREETLPQKILILHQFKTQMLPDRDQIRTPPELAVVVHVDGQGSLGSKYGTWAAMLDAPIGPEQRLWWAWKNFIDEDFPTATPGQVNAVEPLPVIVTYQ